MEFDNLDSRPGKSWNFGSGPGKSWNFMLANFYAAELPTVLDCLTCTVFDVITELFAYVIMGQKKRRNYRTSPSTMTYRYLGNTTQNY